MPLSVAQLATVFRLLPRLFVSEPGFTMNNLLPLFCEDLIFMGGPIVAHRLRLSSKHYHMAVSNSVGEMMKWISICFCEHCGQLRSLVFVIRDDLPVAPGRNHLVHCPHCFNELVSPRFHHIATWHLLVLWKRIEAIGGIRQTTARYPIMCLDITRRLNDRGRMIPRPALRWAAENFALLSLGRHYLRTSIDEGLWPASLFDMIRFGDNILCDAGREHDLWLRAWFHGLVRWEGNTQYGIMEWADLYDLDIEHAWLRGRN